MKIYLWFIVWLFFLTHVKADFLRVVIGINGLTCSQCSRSVEIKLRGLDFVDDIKMDLENNVSTITFLENKTVRIEKIAQAVVNAGFSVRYLKADFDFSGIEVSANNEFVSNGSIFHLLQESNAVLPAKATLEFIGAGFMAAKAWKKWKNKVKSLQSSSSIEKYYVIFRS